MNQIVIIAIALLDQLHALAHGHDPFTVLWPVAVTVFTALTLLRVAVVCSRIPKSR